MYFVYVLECRNDKSLYIGFTLNLKNRLLRHYYGIGAKATSRKWDWRLIYYEAYFHKKDAIGREIFLKSGSGRKFLKKQLNNYFTRT